MFEKKRLAKIIGIEQAYNIVNIVENYNECVYYCSTKRLKNKFYSRIISAAEHGTDFSNVENIHQLIIKACGYEVDVGGVAGFTAMNMNSANAAKEEKQHRMVCVEEVGNNMKIYRDKRTGVHYLLYINTRSKHIWKSGDLTTAEIAMCVLVDKDGKPLL